jgi:hypothetical protein
MITGKWKPKEWISTKEDKYQELLKYYNLEYAFNKALDHVDAHMDEDDDIESEYQFDFDNSIQAATGGMGITGEYESYDKTQFSEIMGLLECTTNSCIILQDARYSMHTVFIVQNLEDNSYIYVDFSNDNRTHAGNVIDFVIEHSNNLRYIEKLLKSDHGDDITF